MALRVFQHACACLLLVVAACAGGGERAQRPSGRDPVELSGNLLNVADLVSSKFQEAYVNAFAANASPHELAAIAVTRNEATANVRAMVLGPDPQGDLVDLYVWSRVALHSCRNRQAHMADYKGFDCASTYGAVDEAVRDLAVAWLPPEQLARVELAVESFVSAHPDMLTAGLFRLSDLADQTGMRIEVLRPSGGDMFSSLNDTAQQLQRTRLLGQQALWLMSRMSTMVGWEAQTTVAVAMENERLRGLSEGLAHIGPSMQAHADSVDRLAVGVATQGHSVDGLSASIRELSQRVDAVAKAVPSGDVVRGMLREAMLLGGAVVLAVVGMGGVVVWWVVRQRR